MTFGILIFRNFDISRFRYVWWWYLPGSSKAGSSLLRPWGFSRDVREPQALSALAPSDFYSEERITKVQGHPDLLNKLLPSWDYIARPCLIISHIYFPPSKILMYLFCFSKSYLKSFNKFSSFKIFSIILIYIHIFTCLL